MKIKRSYDAKRSTLVDWNWRWWVIGCVTAFILWYVACLCIMQHAWHEYWPK